jgi:hypothetical protein
MNKANVPNVVRKNPCFQNGHIEIIGMNHKHGEYTGTIQVGSERARQRVAFDLSSTSLVIEKRGYFYQMCFGNHHCYDPRKSFTHQSDTNATVDVLPDMGNKWEPVGSIVSDSVKFGYAFIPKLRFGLAHKFHSKGHNIALEGIFGLACPFTSDHSAEHDCPIWQVFKSVPEMKKILTIYMHNVLPRKHYDSALIIGGSFPRFEQGPAETVTLPLRGQWKLPVDQLAILVRGRRRKISITIRPVKVDLSDKYLRIAIEAIPIGLVSILDEKLQTAIYNELVKTTPEVFPTFLFKIGSIHFEITHLDYVECMGRFCYFKITYCKGTDCEWTFGRPFLKKHVLSYSYDTNQMRISLFKAHE